MLNRCLTIMVCGLLVAAFASPAGATVVITETFDDDDGGWRSGISGILTHVADGGNPGGFIRVVRNLEESPFPLMVMMFDSVESPFTGDFAAAGIHAVTVDLNFLTGPPVAMISNFTAAWVRFRYDGSHNGWRFSLTDTFPMGQWNTYGTGYFDPTWTDAEAVAAGWIQEGEPNKSFAETMASVGITSVRLLSENPSTDEAAAGIDNFTVIARRPTCIPGDANCDGVVDLDDFVILKKNFGTEEGATWDMGDFNGDGKVDLDDFAILKRNFGATADDS